MNPYKSKLVSIFTASLMLTFLASSIKPSKAFIPDVYLPVKKELDSTSINIGKTAIKLLKYNQPKEALRLSKLAISLNSQNLQLWIILAESQVRLNLLKDAIQSLSKAEKLDENIATILFFKASVYSQLEKPNAALKLINKGLLLEPQNPGGYFQQGNALIKKTKLRKALNSFNKAYSINNNFWQALNNKGLVLYEMNKTKDAVISWRKALEIKKDAETMLALSTAIYEENENEAIELAKTALINNPNYVSEDYQKSQLWGSRLRQDTKKLFKNPKLSSTIDKAFSATQ